MSSFCRKMFSLILFLQTLLDVAVKTSRVPSESTLDIIVAMQIQCSILRFTSFLTESSDNSLLDEYVSELSPY